MRLDKFLSSNGMVSSRNLAVRLIDDGRISVSGKIILKSSYLVQPDDIIHILGDSLYVSRSADKLRYFLNSISLNINNFKCIDAGASTGGFTQILLENGASKVYSVDVGSSQLDNVIKSDIRVVSIENTDIRNFTLSDTCDLLVCDLSFISLNQVISSLYKLSSTYFILLFKPQFEVGKEIKRDAKGVVKDVNAIEKSMAKFEVNAFSLGLELLVKEKCKIKGKSGNEEYFYFFKK